jgi:hypothetical protein
LKEQSDISSYSLFYSSVLGGKWKIHVNFDDLC